MNIGTGDFASKKQLDLISQSIRNLAHPPRELTGRQRFAQHAVIKLLASASDQGPLRDWIELHGTPAMRREYADQLQKGIANPALTTLPGWAADLTSIETSEFLAAGVAPRLLPRLAALGLQVTISTGPIRVPYPTPGIAPAGGWVGEGMPIPIGASPLSSVLVTPYKAATISTFSSEIRSSWFSLEAILDQRLRSDLGAVIDTTLVDANLATTLRPAGLRALGVEIASTGSMAGDLKALASAVLDEGGTQPVFLMNSLQYLALSFLSAPLTFTALDSASVPVGVVICVDAPSFVSFIGSPQVSIAEASTIHEQTAPLPIVSNAAGWPPLATATATPVRSTWQTDSVGVRVVLPTSWGLALPTSWMEGVAW